MIHISSKKVSVAIALSAVLISGLNAQGIYIDKFFYRDFLDLGQNKGAFAAGAENVTIKSTKQPGVSMRFEAPIIDQSARSNNGNSTALGRNFVITATHVAGSSGDSNDALVGSSNVEVRRWGQTSYSISDGSKSQNHGYDVTFTRFNKYIVEGETEIFDAGLESDKGYSSTSPNKDKEAKNLKKLKDYLRDDATNNKGDLIIFQAGSGTLSLYNAPGLGFNTAGIAAITGTRGGSFSRKVDIDGGITYEDSKANLNINARGIQLIEFTDLDWVNFITPGDSGSGFYIYDKNKKKWLLLGVTSKADLVGGGGGAVAVATKKDFDDFKKGQEWELNLKGHNDWTFEKRVGAKEEFKQNGSEKELQTNKDVVFSGGGTIDIKADMDLLVSSQVGGLVFKKNGSSSTTYTIKSTDKKGFNGSGLDIEQGVKVEWSVGFMSNYKGVDNALHKVGKGTLEITTAYDSSDGKYGYLRVGDGKVVFNTEKQAFNGVYLTSGRGTLELTKDKAQAFGARKDDAKIDSKPQHHFILDQGNRDSLGIYFGNGGGNLDLKGNSLTLNTISSNDSRANIINTDTDTSNPSYITIEGYGYNNEQSNKNKTQSKADTIIHASFGQSTNGTNTANTNNNLNLIYKGEPSGTTKAADSQANGSQAALIFDGNIDAKGLEVTNGKVVLQGHPTTHAYMRNEEVSVTQHGMGQRKKFLELVKGAEGNNLPEWMDFSRPSHLDQPDWDH
ncbi:S6 family peptidase, partial [Helicobacter cinaedi]|uniref:S6 family peptidase n=1 Tax=Helicobacter cinaedi TaxID=213 RepID=UPI002D7965D1